jgi:nucleotide-binding universal stress UspA family protein
MTHVIVSYDGTRNDRDALVLGRLFATAGAEISLAYVRHARERDPEREAAAQRDAEHLLSVGAGLLDGASVGQRVIFNPSTAEGLAALAAELGADVIAFGSSYRTPPGRVDPPQTAQQLMERAVSCSLAFAPAGLRREPVEHSIGTVGVFDEDDDPAARATAESLAHALGAIVTDEEADLLVIGSRREASPGQLLLSGVARERLGQASGPVLAVARGAELTFG